MQQKCEQLMSDYFDSAPGFFYTLEQGQDGGYAMPFASAGMRDVFGIEPGDVAQDIAPFVAVVHPDDSGTIFREIEASARDLICCQFEYRIVHPQKGVRWIAAHSRPQSNSGGGVSWGGFMHDITDHKRMEDKLRTREREFQSLAENLPDNIARWDAAGRILYGNPAHQRTLGKPAAEMIGKTYSELFPDGRYTPVDMAIAQVVETGQPVLFVRQPVPFENGETQIHDVNLVPEHDAGGNVISVLGIWRDMTELYRVQDEIAAREREFHRQTRFQQSLLSGMRNAGIILVVVENGHFVYTNDHYMGCQLGYAEGQLPEKVSFIDLIHPDDRPRIVEMHRDRLVGKPVPTSYEIGALGGDGSRRECEFHVTQVPDTDPPQTLLLALDIAERKRVEMELQRREREFRSLAENLPDVVVRYDRECRRIYVNQAWEKANSIPVREVIGKSPQESSVRLKPIAADFERMLRGVMETGRSDSMELNWCDEARGQLCFELNAIPEFDGHGKAVSVLTVARDITETKDAQRQAAQFFSNFPGFAYSYRMMPDGHGSFPFASPNIEKLYGLKPADVKDDMASLHALAHPDDAPGILAVLVESARTMSPVHMEYRICRPGLPERWAEFRSSPVREADGSVVWHGIMLDIDERKRANEQLVSSQKMLAEAQKIAKLGSWDWDVVGGRLAWSEMAYEIYTPDGRSAEPSFGDFTSSLHPEDLGRVIAATQSALERDTPFDLDHRVVSSSRGVRTVHAYGKVFRDANGKPVRMVGTVQDITEHKQAEIALKERFERINELNEHLEESARNLEERAVELEAAQEQLEQTEAWYRSIIHAAPEGMLVANERGVITLVNAQLESMFGYECGELVGVRVEILLPQALRESHAEQRREYFSRRIERRDAMIGSDLLGCRKDGSTFSVDVGLSRLPEIDGMGSAVCASVRDITARRVMEAAREAALEEAQRLAQLRSVFMAQMSHELRTPLNGILGYAQNLLLQGESLGEKQITGLRIIQNSGEHLLTLINGILDQAAIEADRFELVPGDIELEIFLGAIIGMIRIRAEQKNLAFACEVDADLPAVMRGDAQRLRQVLLNLLVNAVKFTDLGHVTLRVNYIAPSRLRFAVQDSGVGIAAEQREKIFMPFEQVGEISRRAGGNGLGLAISRKLVRLMGGDIRVESELGVGSTLSFEIEMDCVQSGMNRVNAAALSGQATTRVTLATPLLFAPPRQELEVLHGFALRGSMRGVILHAEQLAEMDSRYQPFVEQLRQLAQGFRTKALVNLIAAYRDGKE